MSLYFFPFNISSALMRSFLGIFETGSTPGLITSILLSSTPIFIAKFLVNLEFAITWSTLFKTSRIFLLILDPFL